MKNYLRIYISLALLLSGSKSFAQLHPNLDRFDVYESGGKVYLSWVISSGNTCNGTDILRSEDNINFISVGRIWGVCGSLSEPIAFSYIDEAPVLNKPSYYKLELGEDGYTNFIAIEVIDTKGAGFQVRPNPTNTNTVIYFENTANEEHTLTIVDNSGVTAISQKTNQKIFSFDASQIPSGTYVFVISSEASKKRVYGKCVVRH